MPEIILKNASLEYPVYDAVSRLLTRTITRSIPVGGQIKQRTATQTSVLAVDDICLSLHDGDRVALLGHNGAGKTSLLKMLAGFYEPTSGSIVRKGKVSALLNMMAGMDINSTGYDNILLCGMLYGLERQQIISRSEEIAEFSELGSYLDLPVRLYSQGMMLRLAFSICTAIDCDILLLDEQVGAGDAAFLSKAKTRLSEMIFRSAILVIATHSADVAREFCNKALFLEHGKCINYGPTEAVLEFQASRAA